MSELLNSGRVSYDLFLLVSISNKHILYKNDQTRYVLFEKVKLLKSYHNDHPHGIIVKDFVMTHSGWNELKKINDPILYLLVIMYNIIYKIAIIV